MVDLMSVEFRIKVTVELLSSVSSEAARVLCPFQKRQAQKKNTPSFLLSPTRRYLVLYRLFDTLCFEIQQMDRDVPFISKSSAILLLTFNRIINSRTFSRCLSACQSKFERSVALSRRPPLTFSSGQLRLVLFLQCLQRRKAFGSSDPTLASCSLLTHPLIR